MNAHTYKSAELENQRSPVSRRGLLAGFGAAATIALTGNVASAAGSASSGIDKHIEAHRAAYVIWVEMCDRADKILSDLFASGVRDAGQHPAYLQAELEGQPSNQAEKAAFLALLSYRPQTLTEVWELFDYLQGKEAGFNEVCPSEEQLDLLFASLSTPAGRGRAAIHA